MTDCGHFRYEASTPDLERFGLGVPALQYQLFGYAVLPLVRGGKKPHRMLPPDGGVYHASIRPHDVSQWWHGDPAANIGVATGQRSRLLVIDLDVKGEHDGPAGFWRFLREHGLDGGMWHTETPSARTPSGGRHLWFRTPAGTAVPERPSILPGVDIKGDGGLVVAPPSMKLVSASQRPGDPSSSEQVPVPYEWTQGCPCQVPDAPAWLWDWMASVPDQQQSPGSDGPGVPELEQLKRDGIPEGERNSTFYRLACSLYRRYGVHSEASLTVITHLKDVWDATSHAGMTWSEILVIIQSARKFMTNQIENVDPRRQAQLEQASRGWQRERP